MTDLSRRSTEPELIDELSIPPQEMNSILKQVTWLNNNFGRMTPILNFIFEAHRRLNRPVVVVDLGCGQGDHLIKIAEWSARQNCPVQLIGVDQHPSAVKLARQNCTKYGIDIMEGDAVATIHSSRLGEADIFISTLFTHHLNDTQIVALLGSMSKKARYGWFIDDLQRSGVSRGFVKMLTAVGRFHPIVQNDARVSIERGFSRKDWANYLEQAKVPAGQTEIFWNWAFRYGVLYRRHFAN